MRPPRVTPVEGRTILSVSSSYEGLRAPPPEDVAYYAANGYVVTRTRYRRRWLRRGVLFVTYTRA